MSDVVCVLGHMSDVVCGLGHMSDVVCGLGHMSDVVCGLGHMSDVVCGLGQMSYYCYIILHLLHYTVFIMSSFEEDGHIVLHLSGGRYVSRQEKCPLNILRTFHQILIFHIWVSDK
jgi:hypothetical protein